MPRLFPTLLLAAAVLARPNAAGQTTPIPYERSAEIRGEELERLQPSDFECPPCEGGYEYRWPVKILIDQDAAGIRMSPVRLLTVAEARRLPRPDLDMRNKDSVSRRRVSPHEFEVFRI